MSGSAAAWAAAAGADAPPAAGLAETRALIEQWVQARQLAGRTAAEWDTEKETLQQTKILFERELTAVAEQMSRVSTNSTQADAERLKAEAEITQATNALARLTSVVTGIETKIRAVTPLLPPLLLDTVEPFLNRIPTNAVVTKASAAERLQTVVGILNEIDKFNAAVTLANERQPDADGRLVSVDTLYFGLGAAYYVDAEGKLAGFGQPGPEGWKWTAAPEIGPAVQDAQAMYRNNKQAAFVGLPATLR